MEPSAPAVVAWSINQWTASKLPSPVFKGKKKSQTKGDRFCCHQTGRGKSEDFCSDAENISLVKLRNHSRGSVLDMWTCDSGTLRPVLKSNRSIFCKYKLFLRMPCLQPLLKVSISDPQAKWSEYFILCFGSGDKLHKNGFWRVWVEKAGGSSVWPGAQGEARLRGCGGRLGEGHLLQGIVRIPGERRMESPEELHLEGQTKHLRAGVNGVEEGCPVLGLEVWTELPK